MCQIPEARSSDVVCRDTSNPSKNEDFFTFSLIFLGHRAPCESIFAPGRTQFDNLLVDIHVGHAYCSWSQPSTTCNKRGPRSAWRERKLYRPPVRTHRAREIFGTMAPPNKTPVKKRKTKRKSYSDSKKGRTKSQRKAAYASEASTVTRGKTQILFMKP